MAGFSWSAFLTLYLTAIAFPQGAGLSLETKASRGGKMPDSTSGPVIMSQPSRNISLLNGKSRDSLQNNTDKGCPNCNNNEDEESDLYKVRIEMIKAKLLAKLQLDKEPVLKQKPKELRIAALLSNLNLIGEENNHKEPDDSEDEYYGKTTQIIVFSEKAKLPPSQNDQHSSGRLRFHFKLEQNSLPSSVPSALLWLHMRKGKNKELEGRYLHIEALGRRTVRGNTEVQDIKVVRSQVKKEKKSGSGWIVVDVKDIVQHWFSKAAPAHFNDTHKPIYGLDISCRDCETKTSHLISSRGPLRPFLVIDLDKPKALSRKKRQPLDCVGNQPQQECCRRMLYVNFKKIGWDWIIFPEGFHANFCDGTCAGIVDPFYSYPYLLQEVSRANKQERVSICCTPTKMSAISVLHFNNDERVMKIDVPDMRVDACGCF